MPMCEWQIVYTIQYKQAQILDLTTPDTELTSLEDAHYTSCAVTSVKHFNN